MNKALAKQAARESRSWHDPFDSFYEDMDRFFSTQLKRFPHIGFRGDGEGRLLANLDIGETGDEIVVELDAPGVKREDIDITLTDSALRIKGKRESRKEEKSKSVHRIEREYGEFERRVALPCEVDADKIDAALKDGVLTIKLPKSAKAKEQERKIEVHA
ncbi:MAG: Hsp20/alpha crystallin family protein [Amphiplicatus sp.]